MNLLINSLHALDERYPDADPDKILSLSAMIIDYKGKPYLRLTVEDHGCGIAPENMERMFDPFFTTKGRDKGTGLGLSVSDGIVKDHGGMISVQSEVDRVTRFHVDLPLTRPQGPVVNTLAEDA
jgi:signal transduction histidine kinase